MANARICDRCGAFFNPIDVKNGDMIRFKNPVYQSPMDVKAGCIKRKMFENVDPDGLIDLCPYCSEDFELFMNDYPLAMRTDICEENVRGYKYSPIPDPKIDIDTKVRMRNISLSKEVLDNDLSGN